MKFCSCRDSVPVATWEKCGCDRLNILSNRVEFVLDQRTHLWSYFEIPLVGRAAGPESGSLVHCGCIVGDNDQYTNILAKLIVSLRGQPTTWWRHHIVSQKTIVGMVLVFFPSGNESVSFCVYSSGNLRISSFPARWQIWWLSTSSQMTSFSHVGAISREFFLVVSWSSSQI